MPKSIYILLAIIAVTALNVGISRYMINQHKVAVASALDVPKFAVVNEEHLQQTLRQQSAGGQREAAQILADRANLINALTHQNYIVLSSHQISGYPEELEISNVKLAEVYAYLQSNGIPLSSESEHLSSVVSAEQFLKEQLSN